MIDSPHPPAVQTTGYIWDGDIQEFNNLPPRIWWRGLFATLIFAIICWIIYPSWPIGRDYTKGVFNQISYHRHNEKIRSHWNTRAWLFHQLQTAEFAGQRKLSLQRLNDLPFSQITAQPELISFGRSLGKRLNDDNCVPCHGKKIDLSNFAKNDDPAVIHNSSCLSIWQNRLTLSEIKAVILYHLVQN